MLASSNWLALKGLTHGSSRSSKRRKVETLSEATSEACTSIADPESKPFSGSTHMSRYQDSSNALRQMVYGQFSYPPAQLLAGKYVAVDCEMVGIAGDSSRKFVAERDKEDESSLARVSVVNYYGAVQLDVFVRQRERVTDWRTAVSGVRESNMVNAKSFSDVQKLVADLLKDRILVGHAVHNDLKALLLSHPHNMTRDTQVLAGRHGTMSTPKSLVSDNGSPSVKVSVNRKPALRKLVIQELGIDIQSGEHSSVTDARATMAIYRLHRRTWDRGFSSLSRTINQTLSKTQVDRVQAEESGKSTSEHNSQRKKRSRADQSVSSDDTEDPTPSERLGTQRRQNMSFRQRGISSGLSVVVKRRKSGSEVMQVVRGIRSGGKGKEQKDKWWGTLGN